MNETPPCKTHPDAPHGFDRNASHNADRYVCECESWEPVDNVYISKKRVHKTDKSIHEPVAWMLHGELFWPSEYEVISEAGDNAIPLYTAPPQKEWVGLTKRDLNGYSPEVKTVLEYIEAILKRKNT